MAGREVVPFKCEEYGGEFAETAGLMDTSRGDTIPEAGKGYLFLLQ